MCLFLEISPNWMSPYKGDKLDLSKTGKRDGGVIWYFPTYLFPKDDKKLTSCYDLGLNIVLACYSCTAALVCNTFGNFVLIFFFPHGRLSMSFENLIHCDKICQ